jgi:RimJ/RimL family protein N-acetyltransferase
MIDLRQATLDDAATLARIQVDSWKAYEGIFSPAYLAEHNTFEHRFLYWMELLRYEDDRTYLILADGAEVGYITLGYPRDDATEGTVEIGALYLKTDAIGKGYAAYVLRRIFTSVKAAGFDRLTLWVLKDNRRAVDFYRHMGFDFDGMDMTLPIHGAILQTRMSIHI